MLLTLLLNVVAEATEIHVESMHVRVCVCVCEMWAIEKAIAEFYIED